MGLAPARLLARLRWRTGGESEPGERLAPEEAPVAIVHDGSTTAVMMATPADFEEFGVGFSLTEGIIDSLDAIRSLEVAEAPPGVEVRLWLAADAGARLSARRRHLAGPTGCGLCGLESLAEALRSPPQVADAGFTVEAAALVAAMQALADAQSLGRATRAVHAAGLWRPTGELLLREDVGRHNALDKLVGACAMAGVCVQGRVLLLTSRVSVEMVQKAAVLGISVLCAASAPTALAVRTAEAAGITLAGVARADGLEVFTFAQRIQMAARTPATRPRVQRRRAVGLGGGQSEPSAAGN
ncbi:MAG TPA: formate dehydrogenase accessory sulfurtransferase FdhD [Caulobacteraceae bacterium]|nr:formate dehydrogenase accessory sulfurtransferase FdhD [Caulobacteraceae bacterium]